MKLLDSGLMRRLFLSSLVVFMIPLIVFSSVIYIYTRTVIQDSQTEAVCSIMRSNAKKLDEILIMIQNVAFETSYNNTVLAMDSTPATDVISLNLAAKTVMRDLRVAGAKFTPGYGVNLALHFMDNGVVLTNQTKHDWHSYSKTVLQLDGGQGVPTPEQARQSQLIFPTGEGKGGLVYILPLQLYGVSSSCRIIAQIPVWEILEADTVPSYNAIYRGDTLLATDNAGFFAALDPGDRLEEKIVRFEGRRYRPVQVGLDAMEITYYTYVDDSLVGAHVRYINLWLTALVLCVFILSAGLSYAISRRNYRPVGSLMKLVEPYLRTGGPEPSSGSRDEYHNIGRALSGLMQNNSQLRQTLGEQSPLLQRMFLARLLHGTAPGDWDREAALYNIRFPHRLFAVLSISLAGGQNQTFAADVLRSLVTRSLTGEYSGYVLYAVEEDREFLPLILNYDPALSLEKVVDTVLDGLEQAVHVGCSGGAESPGAQALHTLYLQSVTAWCYGSGAEARSNQVAYYTPARGKAASVVYTPEKEQALVRHLAARDPDRAKALVLDIIGQTDKSTSLLTKILMGDLLSTLIRTALQSGIQLGELWSAEQAELFDTSTMENKTRLLLELLEQIAGFSQPRETQKNPLVQRAYGYIHQHYSDPALSLNLVAEWLRVSPQYLSSLFKAESGQNFTEYLNRYRSEAALGYLADLRLPVQKIAQCIGFGSAGSFIRVFKKYYAVTPGQYRESAAHLIQEAP